MRNRMSPEVMKRKGDVLVEAGRLAAEYLVSQGRLSPAVLTAARSPPPPPLPPPTNPDPIPIPIPKPNLNLNLNPSMKDIEVIELDDNDSPPQPAPKGETEEMISELLDNDDDIAAAPGDGSESLPLTLPIAIPDDDSIYMSLGEIPLTYLRPHWEQPPPQDYDKPF